MTSAPLELIRQRRELLIMRSELQRLEMAHYAEPWRKPLAVADRGVSLLQRVRQHPATLLAVASVFAYLNRKRPGRMLYLGGVAWRAWQAMARRKSAS